MEYEKHESMYDLNHVVAQPSDCRFGLSLEESAGQCHRDLRQTSLKATVNVKVVREFTGNDKRGFAHVRLCLPIRVYQNHPRLVQLDGCRSELWVDGLKHSSERVVSSDQR